jgi:hypothetical protein
MKKLCTAHAKSTDAQCKNKAIPGSPYCWRHVAKIPLVISAVLAILSAIFGIFAFEFYRSIVPSDELQELQAASQELKDLRETVEPVMSMISKRYPNIETKKAMTLLTGRLETIENQLINVEKHQSDELTVLRAASKELKELRRMVEPVINLAKVKYPKMDTEDAIDLLVKRIQELEQQVTVVKKHQENEQEKENQLKILMQTTPEVNAYLRPTNEGKYIVDISSENLVPFSAKWLIVTKNNKVISGVMMSNAKFHPTLNQNSWRYKININGNEVIDNFVELRFRFRSAFYAKMGKPDYLKGERIRKYIISTSPPFLQELND